MDVSQIQAEMMKRQTGPLKEFVLNQQEAYEIKIRDQVFRRPGDPPSEEVVEKLKSEKNKADNGASEENDRHMKQEL
ncbi:hypothetical protein L6164_021134 [Bauhinia variegata]|uniref:Uncharacterized protein n=1 Tax=Bauhinia variegata TaxID=167791 RepID=A0ACB9MXL3_BAUVA|nr:hypothetical protein L6164_021134 [Bauhinia variegata]